MLAITLVGCVLAIVSFAMFGLRHGHPVRVEDGAIAVVPLGHPSARALTKVEAALRRTFRAPVVEFKCAPLPSSAYYEPRHRYRADKLVAYLSRWPNWKVVGVTERDISTTAHGVEDFGIMGQGQLGGRACVVSSFRSRAGIGEVAIHEVGHTLGLPHCANPNCVMVDANGTGKVAETSRRFCSSCACKIRSWKR